MLAWVLGDYQAVRKGRMGQRVARRVAAKGAGRLLGVCLGDTWAFHSFEAAVAGP
jgi:hypothetical protein